MPPRFAYWTIILDGTPTAFRAREQAELLPTFNRLKQKDPSAMMKWFSQGRLWDSPEAARAERERLRNEDGARYLAEQREKERRKAEEAAPPPPRQPDGASGPRQDREHGPGPRRDGNLALRQLRQEFHPAEVSVGYGDPCLELLLYLPGPIAFLRARVGLLPIGASEVRDPQRPLAQRGEDVEGASRRDIPIARQANEGLVALVPDPAPPEHAPQDPAGVLKAGEDRTVEEGALVELA